MDLEEATVEKTFRSKKNKVQKINYDGKYFVLKEYNPEFLEGLKIEKDLLESCEERGILVPKIIKAKNDTLILEYISGKNCKRLFDKIEDVKVKKRILSNIASWLAKFHKEFELKKRRGDSILANFISTDEKVYGIDFEEAEEGDPYIDVGDMCTSIMRLRPAFTEERFSQTKFFLNEYFFKSLAPYKDMTEQVSRSLIHYSKYSSMGDLMKEWAEKIRSNGLSSTLQS